MIDRMLSLLARLGMMLSALLFIAGCDHKEIVCPGDTPALLELRFDWQKAPGARPSGMTVYFFPADSHTKLWRFDIAGREGGAVELPLGRYRMLAFNNDLRGVQFSTTAAFDTFTASAMALSPQLVAPSGMLYAAAVDHFEVTMCGVTYIDAHGQPKDCPFGVVRCEPDSVSTVYETIVRHVKGLERVRSARAVLNGIATGITLAQRQTVAPAAATAFALTPDGDSLLGLTTAFGTPPGAPNFVLDIYITRTDGAVLLKKIDVTEQVLNQADRRHVIILIDSLTIPEGEIPPDPSDPGDIGINVGVDPWTTVNIDINGVLQ